MNDWWAVPRIGPSSYYNVFSVCVCVCMCVCMCVYMCGCVFVSMFVWVSVKVSVHCSCICTYNEKVWDSKRESQKSYDSDPNRPTSSTLGDALRPMPRYHRSLLSCAILANSCDLSSRESQKNSFRALFPLFAQILWGEVEEQTDMTEFIRHRVCP